MERAGISLATSMVGLRLIRNWSSVGTSGRGKGNFAGRVRCRPSWLGAPVVPWFCQPWIGMSMMEMLGKTALEDFEYWEDEGRVIVGGTVKESKARMSKR